MRVSIESGCCWRAMHFTGMIGGHTVELGLSSGWRAFWGRYQEWAAQWIDGQLLQIRVPVYSASHPTPQFAVILGGRTISSYAPNVSLFSNWFAAPVWKTPDGELREQKCRIFRLRNAVMDEGGRMVAAWKEHCRRSEGIVRATASTEIVAAVFAIMMCNRIVPE
jgi:hypothetical protein